MMQTVVFKTPGQMDLRAITHMGMNAKPNSNTPIGYFGTGLKFAVAVLVRKGIQLSLCVNGELLSFDTESEDFRGKQFQFIYMHNHNRWLRRKEVELAYTTELGKNWELWQVLRELYANTLDEAGSTYVVDDLHKEWIKAKQDPDHTYIFVHDTDFVQEYADIGRTFLYGAQQSPQQHGDDAVEILQESSKHIYYRGMRVLDLDKPSLYTYNILAKIELTEDRTAKNADDVERIIREHIIQLEEDGEHLIKAILKAPTGTYEQRFNFQSYHYVAPSKYFMSRASTYGRSSTNSTVIPFVQRNEPPVVQYLEAPYLTHLYTAIRDGNYELYDRLWNDFYDDLEREVREEGL